MEQPEQKCYLVHNLKLAKTDGLRWNCMNMANFFYVKTRELDA